MKTKYTEAFIEQALAKLYSRGERTVQSVAVELNVNYHTLKNWMKGKLVAKHSGTIAGEKRPQDWRAEEQLVALHDSYGLSGEGLQGWCRERGLFAHHAHLSAEHLAEYAGNVSRIRAVTSTLSGTPAEDEDQKQRAGDCVTV